MHVLPIRLSALPPHLSGKISECRSEEQFEKLLCASPQMLYQFAVSVFQRASKHADSRAFIESDFFKRVIVELKKTIGNGKISISQTITISRLSKPFLQNHKKVALCDEANHVLFFTADQLLLVGMRDVIQPQGREFQLRVHSDVFRVLHAKSFASAAGFSAQQLRQTINGLRLMGEDENSLKGIPLREETVSMAFNVAYELHSTPLLECCLDYFSQNTNMNFTIQSDNTFQIALNEHRTSKNIGVCAAKKYCAYLGVGKVEIHLQNTSHLRMPEILEICRHLGSLVGALALYSFHIFPQGQTVQDILDLCPNLKRLWLSCDLSTTFRLCHLSQLEVLCIRSGTMAELPPLTDLLRLKEISIYGCRKIQRMPPLEHLLQLECLCLAWCENLRVLPQIENNINLRKLCLLGLERLSVLPKVGYLQHLACLKFENKHTPSAFTQASRIASFFSLLQSNLPVARRLARKFKIDVFCVDDLFKLLQSHAPDEGGIVTYLTHHCPAPIAAHALLILQNTSPLFMQRALSLLTALESYPAYIVQLEVSGAYRHILQDSRALEFADAEKEKLIETVLQSVGGRNFLVQNRTCIHTHSPRLAALVEKLFPKAEAENTSFYPISVKSQKGTLKVGCHTHHLEQEPELLLKLLAECIDETFPARLKVSYKNEAAIDDGGPRRHFVETLIKNIAARYLSREGISSRPEINNPLFTQIGIFLRFLFMHNKHELRKYDYYARRKKNYRVDLYHTDEVFCADYFQGMALLSYDEIENDLAGMKEARFREIVFSLKSIQQEDIYKKVKRLRAWDGSHPERHKGQKHLAFIADFYKYALAERLPANLRLPNGTINVECLQMIKKTISHAYVDKGIVYALHALAKGFIQHPREMDNLHKQGTEAVRTIIQGTYDRERLLKAVKFKPPKAPQRGWFLRWMDSKSDAQLKKFLCYVTGSSVIPKGRTITIEFYNAFDRVYVCSCDYKMEIPTWMQQEVVLDILDSCCGLSKDFGAI